MKILLALDGALPTKELPDCTYSDIIAVDGAATYLQENRYHPNVIIGDLDTLKKHASACRSSIKQMYPDSEIIKITEQETTDFEKALNYLLDYKDAQILIIGMLGNEIDHSVHNLRLFARFGKELNLKFYHDQGTPIAQWGFVLKGSQTVHSHINSTISIIPMPNACISSKGLKWELSHFEMNFDKHTSIRNKIATNQLKLELLNGNAICIITNDIEPNT